MKSNSLELTRFLLKNSRAVKHAPLMMGLIVLVGIISGASNAALLALIGRWLSSTAPMPAQFVIIFFALCIMFPLARFASEAMLVNLSSKAMLALRMQLSRQILSAPLRRLEELGAPRLSAALTQDVPAIGNSLANIPVMTMHISIVVGSLIYLGWLSWPLLLGLIGFMIVGTLTYQIPFRRAMRRYVKVREEWDKLLKQFEAITSGVKEMKLHHDRREAFFFKALQPTADSMSTHAMRGHLNFVAANSWGTSLFFILIGLILFTSYNWPGVNTQTLIGYTLGILYMMTPMHLIMSTIPSFASASVSMQ
jgi:putative pyoverdin transport system ATP-binding/permease protein